MKSLLCTIVLLPSDEAAPIEKNLITENFDLFAGFADEYDCKTYIPNHPKAFNQFYNMYLISECKVQKGDYYYDRTFDEILRARWSGPYSNDIPKVIASTDSELKTLPKIPASILEEFVDSKGNLLAVNLKTIYSPGNRKAEEHQPTSFEVAVNSENEVIIAKKQESYSREEVIFLINKFFAALNDEIEITFNSVVKNCNGKSELSAFGDDIDMWIENNL